MSAQGSSAARTLGQKTNNNGTLKGFANRLTLSGFRRNLNHVPWVLAALEPRAEISERLRRIPNRRSSLDGRLLRHLFTKHLN